MEEEDEEARRTIQRSEFCYATSIWQFMAPTQVFMITATLHVIPSVSPSLSIQARTCFSHQVWILASSVSSG